MKEKKEAVAPETVEAVGTTSQEQNMEQEITFPDPCVYCGPSVKGVAKQYTVYTGGNVPLQLRNFVRQHPAAKGLVTTIGRFAKMRERLETPGTAEALLFQKIKAEL